MLNSEDLMLQAMIVSTSSEGKSSSRKTSLDSHPIDAVPVDV